MHKTGQILKIIFLLAIMLGYLQLHAQKVISKRGSGEEVVIVSRSGKTIYTQSSNGIFQDFQLEYRGEIVISDNDEDIKSISSGGYFELRKYTFGNRREIRIRESGGKLIKEYYEGRKEMPWNPDGKEWLADILPEVLRSTGIGAESRVKRIYRKEGVDGVMNELGRIRSDHVKTIYVSALLDVEGLKNDDLEQIVEKISREISSDHYLSQILIKNVDRFMSSEGSAKAYFRGVRELSSDHYASSALRSAIKQRDLSDELLVEVLNASEDINSDHYISTVLAEVLKQDRLNKRVLSQLIETTENMSSDHYKTVVLKRALKEPNLSIESFNSLMNSVTDMSSDHYITEVLKELMDKSGNNLTDEFLQDIIQFTMDMSSDHYIHVILKDLISDYDLSDKAFEELMQTVSEMSSDHYISVILMKASEKPDLSSNAMISIIKSTSRMSSDHYTTQVLLRIAPKIEKDDERVRSAFKEAVKNVRSDHYYGKLMRSLDY